MVETAGINITWLQTDSGRTATAPCPNTAISATRNCSVNATWGEPFVCNCLLSSDSQQLCASNVRDSDGMHEFVCSISIL